MGKRGRNPMFRPNPRLTTFHDRQSPQTAAPLIVVPPTGPSVRKIESYPLADFLYDLAKAAHDLALANRRWLRYKETLTEYERDQVERIEKLFRKKVVELS
jgi:hypothetical protein